MVSFHGYDNCNTLLVILIFCRLEAHANDADIDEGLQIVGTGRGAPLGVKPGEIYDDDDDSDILATMKRKKAEQKESVKQAVAPDKDLSQMTKEEKLSYLEKLKAVRKEERLKEEKAVSVRL